MRVPLSIARWHRHANWCVPAVGQEARWLEWRGSHPLFGPDSRIASKTECDSVGGEFHDVFDPWMVHAHVFSEDDLDSVWGDGHEASHKGCEQAAMCRVRTEPQILHRRD
ncbi:MAG: hypothetical protein Q8K82_19395 [Gemmatimonadaceae bacterium]|nr:hypothetical protein [Gemmatimonadaceae bacterium]